MLPASLDGRQHLWQPLCTLQWSPLHLLSLAIAYRSLADHSYLAIAFIGFINLLLLITADHG